MVKSQALKFIKSTIQRLQRTSKVTVDIEQGSGAVGVMVEKVGVLGIYIAKLIPDLERLSKESLRHICLDMSNKMDIQMVTKS